MPQPSSLDMAKKLVSFDTTSRNSNLELISFVADYLREIGVDSTVIHNDEGTKANLWATIGPADVPGVVLSGHTDVVPVDGQEWRTPPFEAAVDGDRLYGRGTSDMKSFIAVALAHAPAMAKTDLKMPIHFAFSYDEEIGCLGVHGIIKHVGGISPRPRAVIVGEPTEMRVVNAHKGVFSFRTTVRGLEAHSSATHVGVNAIMYAAELIGFLSELARERREERPHNHHFDPPYTSVHVGTIRGGTALNIIPKECSFVWEYRLLPGEDDREIISRFEEFADSVVLPKMQAVSAQAAIVTEARSRVAPLVAEAGSPAETLAMLLAGTNKTSVVSFGTEGGIFQEAGIPTVVCGPGSILQAHKPDEFIELSQIRACEEFVARLTEYAAGQRI
jgi:acetylornithine deacetylase